MEQLHASPLVNLRIHSTRLSPVSTTRNSSLSFEESKNESPHSESILSTHEFGDVGVDKRGPVSASSSLYSSLTINQGRPDITAIITDTVTKADRYDRIAVAACGPNSIIQVARKSVAKNIKVDGPSLELHCEQFGW